ncbi:bifunctional DNA primase/helicase [Bartonella krasnovii]|uniref:bifunctional DNA primase/helicase n=1 Tax=Bartonella krasnovii TaxID=2267275 RepID=UPI001F4C62CC|nr:bifunctional DNA primase/helicase [Bartonella krasnovii]UNF50058.1 toprim domain-containing protein [Bartonella krasnovii]
MSTIFEIKQKLIAQADRIAEMLLPQGYKRGNHWIVGNTRGEPGQSLSICLNGTKAGLWYDFAEGIGGDILDLWCEVKGINLSQALEEARAALNLTRPKPFMVAQRSYRRPPVPKGHPPKNRVKTYLHKERHIPLEVIKRYRIGEEGEKIIFPFYKPDGTLALVKERLAQAGAKTKPTTAQCEPILFGWQALYPTNHPHTSNPAASTHTTTHTPNPTPTAHTTPHTPKPTASTHTAPHTPNPAASTHTTPHTPKPTASTHTAPHTPNPAASTHTAPHTPNPAASAHTTPQIPQHADPALFPMLSSTNRTIVITEGEIDALSLAAYGYPAVSVPFGGGKGGKHNWIENEFDHLEAFETIFLATDMDQPGEEAAHEIASRLGRHRCYRVRLPRKDANECLTAGIDADTIKAAFTCAKSFAPEGLRRALDYKDQVIGLFWPEPEKHLGYTVPYPKLEGKLHFRPAELTLWSGASGAGKSQLLSDCIPHWIAQNSRLCLASLEMKGEQSLRRLTKQTGGLEKPTKETIERILHFLDDGLILYEHVGKSSVDTLLDVFDYCRARYGCDQFIIDSLMRLGIVCDDYAGQEQAVYKMVDWAILNNVHIHLVAHARKGGLDKDIPGTEDIKGASEIGANAFNIITIWRNRSLEDKIFAASLAQEKADLTKRPGVIMNIAKQRSGDFEGKVGLWFDPQTYRYRCSFEQSFPRRYL